MSTRHHALLLIPFLAVACVEPLVVDPDQTGETAGSTGTPTGDATTLPPPATTIDPPFPTSTSTSVDADSSASDGAGSSTGPGGLGEGEECDLHLQDCAPGLKCMPYSTDGSTWWDATACFPVDPDPQGLGEPCQWQERPWSGHDDCGVGQVCWSYDQLEGECKGLCLTDDPDHWNSQDYTCEDPRAIPGTTCQDCFCYCEVPCDPLGQDCGEGEECVPYGDSFDCAPDASGDAGAYGDSCEFVNVCDPGLVCLDASDVPGCESAIGCCSPLCDVTQPTTGPGAAEGQTCQPWYAEGTAPPGYENVGACVLDP